MQVNNISLFFNEDSLFFRQCFLKVEKFGKEVYPVGYAPSGMITVKQTGVKGTKIQALVNIGPLVARGEVPVIEDKHLELFKTIEIDTRGNYEFEGSKKISFVNVSIKQNINGKTEIVGKIDGNLVLELYFRVVGGNIQEVAVKKHGN